MFSAALQSGQLGPLMQQFGMSADVIAAANSGGNISLLFPLLSAKPLLQSTVFIRMNAHYFIRVQFNRY